MENLTYNSFSQTPSNASTRAARTSSDPYRSLYSDHMLAELLVLQEEMVAQLRFERLEVVSHADFITGLIDEHETAAALLRAQLGNRPLDTVSDGVTIITRQDNSDAENPLPQGLLKASSHRVPSAQASLHT